MDPIEKAIRAALEKGDQGDAGFRRRIYDAAHVALSRSVSAKIEMGDHAKRARFMRLSSIVAVIETEFSPATAPMDTPVLPDMASYRPPLQPRAATSRVEPDYGRADPREVGAVSSDNGNADAGYFEEPQPSILRKLALISVTIAILVLLVLFGWTAWNSGLFSSAGVKSAGPGHVATQDESAGPAQLSNTMTYPDNWITVFEPTDVASVQVSEGLTAELKGAGEGAVLKIMTDGKSNQADASFEIGRGILETLRGKKVIFNIKAKTTEGAAAQIAVTCSLAGLGECQRLRFRLDGQLTENLIAVQLADVAPEASGTFVLTPNIDKGGNPVELVGISVREDN